MFGKIVMCILWGPAIAFTISMIVMGVLNALMGWEDKNRKSFYTVFATIAILLFMIVCFIFFKYN
ncbi:MAG: hypothetical protein PHH61_06290 [Candidatus Nanoarchaeia archaeon]|nr:hypothetical protein [Candidatus Nanoarchaeia archaeon]